MYVPLDVVYTVGTSMITCDTEVEGMRNQSASSKPRLTEQAEC